MANAGLRATLAKRRYDNYLAAAREKIHSIQSELVQYDPTSGRCVVHVRIQSTDGGFFDGLGEADPEKMGYEGTREHPVGVAETRAKKRAMIDLLGKDLEVDGENLFLQEEEEEEEEVSDDPHCDQCGAEITPYQGKSGRERAREGRSRFGQALCARCLSARKKGF